MNGIDNETLARWAAMGCCPSSVNGTAALLELLEQSHGVREEKEHLESVLSDASSTVAVLERALLANDGSATAILQKLKDMLKEAL